MEEGEKGERYVDAEFLKRVQRILVNNNALKEKQMEIEKNKINISERNKIKQERNINQIVFALTIFTELENIQMIRSM